MNNDDIPSVIPPPNSRGVIFSIISHRLTPNHRRSRKKSELYYPPLVVLFIDLPSAGVC